MKKGYILIAVLTWTILTIISFFWNLNQSISERQELVLKGARASFEQIVLFRMWNAEHGGVYVPVSDTTKPNPYLKTELRDIKINSKLTLTKINPAYMTRQISDIASKREGVKFHITSLNPIRPANRANKTETAALKSFEKGEKGQYSEITDRSGTHFFYMAPLITEKSCLKCHSFQGYREGDVRGGISVILPFTSAPPYLTLITGHMFILLIGVGGIIFAGKKLIRAYDTIQRQAAFDALTGIPNRRSFSERLLSEFSRSRRNNSDLSVIIGDIDHFKLYNDTYGHPAGDKCLQKVAQAIEKTLKRPGDFCARYGGEEFIIILPETSLTGAIVIAEEIRKNILALQIPHSKPLKDGMVTISQGVASKKATTPFNHEDLLKRADDALYSAKEKGRNRVETFTEKKEPQ